MWNMDRYWDYATKRLAKPTSVKILHRGPKGNPDELVARRVEQVAAVRRVDVEEDTRDYNRLLLEELFEKCLG
jgi:hypothetical protein